MNAVVMDHRGPPEVLHAAQLPVPVIRDTEALVRVRAIAVSPGDCRERQGLLGPLPPGQKQCTGADFAGEVEAVGSAVTNVKPGDAVFGFSLDANASAEYIAFPARLLAPKPRGLSHLQAAAVPLSATTALQALRDAGRCQPGSRVLVIGASGGVGTFAVQLARILGAHVTGVCSGRNVGLVQQLGAEQVIDYTRGELTRQQDRYDLVLNTVSSTSFRQLRRLIRWRGTYVTVSLPVPPLDACASLLSSVALRPFRVHPDVADLKRLTGWIEEGRLRPIIEEALPLERLAEAHRAIELGRTRGKRVIAVDRALLDEPPRPRA